MSDIKNDLRRQVLSLNKDETYVVLAIVQSLRVKETGDAICGTVPDGMTKADCKRLIKTMREKQSGAPASMQQTGQRAITHIRNVWIPQIKSHDQKAG